jgi:hypothetical protein
MNAPSRRRQHDLFIDLCIWFPLFAVCLSQQTVEIERSGEHGQSPIRQMRPLLARTIPIQFYTVLVRIAQVKSLAHSVIGRTIERDAGAYDSPKRITQFGAGRIKKQSTNVVRF